MEWTSSAGVTLAAPRAAVCLILLRLPKRLRQQLFQTSRDRFPTIADANNSRIAAKFRQHLPARAARSNRLRSRSVENQRPDLRMAPRNRLKDRVALSTDSEPIRRILKITSAY